MKKLALLLILIPIALFLDGTLSKDVFDYRITTFSGWLGLLLLVMIAGVLVWAEATKNHEKENNLK
ncbi:MAG: hypothetical protein COV67_04170 [Nitrospinae bacterium CG11_big_fil_rev_8_21_14_0_20_56_8]|nr:MAG: hypothetical protein COV67_04170 [Nitrospinae bacterium CG11_big_fil_rev_8_21_14_0_20_56_8]